MNSLSPRAKKLLVYGALYLVMIWMIVSVFVLKAHNIRDLTVLRVIIIIFATVLLTKYFLYMLVSPWHDVLTAYRNRKYRTQLAAYHPLVSVMIPAWNESKGVIGTIKTILRSTYRNIEIIVINDGSTDDSDGLIRAFVARYHAGKKRPDIGIIYEYQQNGGKGSALNRAIGRASGDILVSIDADCAVMPYTIESFVIAFIDPAVDAVVGNVKIGNTESIVGVVQYLEYLFSFYFKKAESMMNIIYIIGGAAGAFRRNVFDTIGLYNTSNITEDIDLSVRIQDAGMKIAYADNAVVYTEGASDIVSLAKQRLRWKRGRFETFSDYRHLFFSDKSRHNKILTWLILPLAIFGELQISLELFFIAFLYLYAILTNDFSSFISGIIVVASMFFIQIFFDNVKSRSWSFYVLAPIGWLLFYVSTFVEWKALFQSVRGMLKHEKLRWQRWDRKGITQAVRGIVSKGIDIKKDL